MESWSNVSWNCCYNWRDSGHSDTVVYHSCALLLSAPGNTHTHTHTPASAQNDTHRHTHTHTYIHTYAHTKPQALSSALLPSLSLSLSLFRPPSFPLSLALSSALLPSLSLSLSLSLSTIAVRRMAAQTSAPRPSLLSPAAPSPPSPPVSFRGPVPLPPPPHLLRPPRPVAKAIALPAHRTTRPSTYAPAMRFSTEASVSPTCPRTTRTRPWLDPCLPCLDP